MSSITQRVLMELGFRDAGFTSGIKAAGSQVAGFSANTLVGARTGGTFAATVGNIGTSLIATTAATVGFVGAIGTLAAITRKAIIENDQAVTANLRLRLALQGNVEELAAWQRIAEQAPTRIFDDDDVLQAAAMAQFVDLNRQEFEQLLPIVRGVAAVTGQQLPEAFTALALAIETKSVRALRNYGITTADWDAISQKAYKAHFKDLDDTAQRWVVLQSILEKGQPYLNAEAELVGTTLAGAWKNLGQEIGNTAQEMVGGQSAIIEFLNAVSSAVRVAGGATPVYSFDRRYDDVEAARARRAAEMTAPSAATAPPGGVKPDPQAIEAARRAREDDLKEQRQALSIVNAMYRDSLDRQREAREAHDKAAAKSYEEDGANFERAQQIKERASEDRLARERERNAIMAELSISTLDVTTTAALTMYETMSQAAYAYFSGAENMEKRFTQIVIGSAKLSAAGVLKELGAVAAKKAALYAAEALGLKASLLPGWLGSGSAAAASVKFAGLAVAAGVAASALQASGEKALSAGEATPSAFGTVGQPGREGRRAFGVTMTRPVENLTINVITTLQAENQFIGSDMRGAVQTLFDEYMAKYVRQGIESGRLAA